jgi:hypothetical protein
MHVEKLGNEREWETFLKASPEGTFYHSLKWKEIIEKSFPYSALYLAVKDSHGTIVGICPGFILNSMHMKIYYSTPYSDYGGPVITGHCIKQASLSLLSFLQMFCLNNNIAYAKICFTDTKLDQPFKFPFNYVDMNKGTVEIDLMATPSDFILNKVFSKKRRKKIRRLERNGFEAREARTKSDLRDFYNLYHKNMKYIGASTYPYKFIENMWCALHPANLRIWLLEKERRIAGILVFKYGEKTYWAYVGIDRKHARHYSVIPYLLWKEIKTAEEEGYRYVSLGGTPSDSQHPYYLQKTSFGGLFNQQQVIWYPFSFTGRILLRSRAKTISAWKVVRNFLPIDFKSIVENKLSKL